MKIKFTLDISGGINNELDNFKRVAETVLNNSSLLSTMNITKPVLEITIKESE